MRDAVSVGTSSRSRRAGLACLALAGLLVTGCGATDAPADVVDPLPVTLHRVGDGRMDRAVSAAGTVRLRRETPLAFLADGRVLAVSVREGDMVRAGQLLATLDRTAIDAQVQSAGSRLRQADAELARQRELFTKGWVAKSRVEAAEAAADTARAELSGARFTQRFSTIAAPAAGVILARTAEPGQTLVAGAQVVLLGEFASGFVLRVPLPASRMAGLAKGQAANVSFRDGAAPSMAAQVIEIAGRAEPTTGTFQVEFALPAHPALRSGLIADVSLPGSDAAGSTAVPATALFAARADEGFVWALDRSRRRVTARLVKLGQVTPQGVEILSGLGRGELIVESGVDRLTEGAPVKAVQSRAG